MFASERIFPLQGCSVARNRRARLKVKDFSLPVLTGYLRLCMNRTCNSSTAVSAQFVVKTRIYSEI